MPKDETDKNLQEKNKNKIYVNPNLYGVEFDNSQDIIYEICEKDITDDNVNNVKNDTVKSEIVWRLKFTTLCIFTVIFILAAIFVPLVIWQKIVSVLAAIVTGFCCFHLLVEKDIEVQLKQLDKVRQAMHDLVNPNKMYERLGVDTIKFVIGENLIPIADPDQEGMLLAKLAALRQRLTDELGYIIPNCRIMDDSQIDKNKYEIYIRGKKVDEGYVYPNAYMVIAEQWDKTGKPVPLNAIKNFDPTHKVPVYWMRNIDVAAGVLSVSPVDVIITHLHECAIKYANQVISKTDAIKVMELVKSQDPTLVNDLIPIFLSPVDLKEIMANLISQKISVKDIIFIFEILNNHARFTQNSNELTEIIKKELNFTNNK